jgi:ABC-type phosphate transport system ATPase subunit
LSVWLRAYEGAPSTGQQTLAWFDKCEGIGCNPTCSEIMTKRAPYDDDIIEPGWSWASRVFAAIVLLTTLVVQIHFCKHDSKMFRELALLRKHEVDFGSPAFHYSAPSEAAVTQVANQDAPRSKPGAAYTAPSSKDAEDDSDKVDHKIVVHSATFYAPHKTGSKPNVGDGDLVGQESSAERWSKSAANAMKPKKSQLRQQSLTTGTRTAAKTAGRRRLASLSTLNLVYDVEYKDSNTGKHVRKRVVNGVSVIMNPGELVAIMGPSGSGKTTLLDCIARPAQKVARMQGDVFINGVSTRTARGLAIHSCSIGYVRQLTTPWDPNLTVLENMVYAARLRLPKDMPHGEKLAIVSKCIADTGMTGIMDSLVGGLSGGGISGGQKRLLSVALQMILTPAVLIMDEPTVSGCWERCDGFAVFGNALVALFVGVAFC